MQNEVESFHRRCGEILRLALAVEEDLDFFISNYFCRPQNYRTFLLNDLILVNTTFGRKVDIFKEICKKENINVREIIETINFIKKTRNKIAHFEAHIENPKNNEITLWSRESVKYKEDILKPTDELVKELNEKKIFAINGINKIYLDLLKKENSLSKF